MNETKRKAEEFVKRWRDKGNEKQESQKFWLDLLGNVFDIPLPTEYIDFERPVMLDHTSFIDGYIKDVKVLIEQKSAKIDLHKVIKQSNGELLTAWEQAKRYMVNMPVDEHPRYIIICNFRTFHIYDMNDVGSDPSIVNLEDLPLEYNRLNVLKVGENPHIQKEEQLSEQAGVLVGKIYDALLERYTDKNDPHTLKSLNMLCVRFVFCLYAEDAGLFGKKSAFYDYMKQFPAKLWHSQIKELFRVLNQKPEERDKYIDEELAAFPYVNGGLFKDVDIEIPSFSEELVRLILDEGSLGFNWSEISPTIFGAVFEATLNPITRRSGGMHYTSISNIHKVINPLFLDDLRQEFEEIKKRPKSDGWRTKYLKAFQEKLANMKFLDPACGSGNFLTETYLSLRKLENSVIRELNDEIMAGQLRLAVDTQALQNIKVSIMQFYGLEINDFAVTVAKTALWIAESQMLEQTEEIIGEKLNFFPLQTNLNIVEGNALTIDWNDVIKNTSVNYIMGNPPFIGARQMDPDSPQKKDIKRIFDGVDQSWDLDYVCCWYMKAFKYMTNTCRAAFISTDSITSGVQAAILQKVMKEQGCKLDFAYESFKWTNDTSQSAQVFCVVIGFSKIIHTVDTEKYVYRADGTCYKTFNINWALRSEDVVISSRKTPICDVPQMVNGNMERGGVNLILEEGEKDEILKKEPSLEKYIKPFYGTNELMGHKKRYCIWLVNADYADIANSKILMERVEKVRKHRLESKAKTTRQYAANPTLFAQRPQPEGCDFIIVPRVTSKSKYLPMAFMKSGIIVSDKAHLIPNATLYHFGILVSRVHELWTDSISMKMGEGYSYSKELVYNNFPWPVNPTEDQIANIEKTAAEILKVRESLSSLTLKQMYGKIIPPELLKAHMENDKAVLRAYGFIKRDLDGKRHWMSEDEVVSALIKMYEELR